MTTVVNTPGGDNGSGFSSGLLIGILLLVVVGFLVYRYGMAPRANDDGGNSTINIEVPTPNPDNNNGGTSTEGSGTLEPDASSTQ